MSRATVTSPAAIACRLLVVGATVVLPGCGESAAPSARAEAVRSPADARKCLTDAGFRVLGGPRSPGDRNAPDTELIVGGDGEMAFVAYYDELARAERYEPKIRRNARRFEGDVERRGQITVIWVRWPRGDDARAETEECVF